MSSASIAQAAQAMQAGRPQEAEAILRRLIVPTNREAAAYAALSDLLLSQKRFAESIDISERGLKVAASDKALANTIVVALVGAERYDEAIARLQRTITSTPRFAQAHAFLGSIFAKRGDVAAAAKALAQATALNPRDAVSLVALGECELIMQHAEPALAALDRGLAITPYDVRGLSLKTLALAGLGRTDAERALADPERLVHNHPLDSLGWDNAAAAQLNQALSAFASNEPSLAEDPPQYATTKAWHSTVNLAEQNDPAVVEFRRLVRRVFEQRISTLRDEDPAHPFVRSKPPAYHLDLWAIRMRDSGQLLPHIHADGWLSGVYYVDIPSVVNDPSANRAGWIEFGHPRNDIKLAHSPIIHAVKPAPGSMISFPSYIWHATVPLPAANVEQRLCLAYDL
ncbi:MAG: putative 2OG-Fe(II) oxygenase, partial [Burkholderiales bacterium]